MPEMHLRRLGSTYSACGPFAKKQRKNTKIKKKQVTNDIFIKTNKIKLAFNITWLIENLII